MSKYIFLFCFSFFSTLLMSQNDSLQNEILNYQTKTHLIFNGRQLLFDNFSLENFKKTNEIRNYLLDIEDEDYTTLFPSENWLLLYWLNGYEELLTDITDYYATDKMITNHKITPTYDKLFIKLKDKTSLFYKEIISQINDFDLSNEKTDFLELFLMAILADEMMFDFNRVQLNSKADAFLEKHPNSIYKDIIKQNIRYKYITSDWGLGLEFFSGYGIMTNGLSDKYTNNIPLGIAFDIEYKKFILYLRGYLGFGRTNLDYTFSDGTIWQKKSQISIAIPEASFGYEVFQNKKFKIAPFIGISGIEISPTEKDLKDIPQLEELKIKTTRATSLGLNIDFKMGSSMKYFVTTSGKEDSYWFLRLRYTYNIGRLDKFYDGLNGNIHMITVGLGGLGRKIKRDL